MAPEPRYSVAAVRRNALVRALRRRCPQCGHGGLYRGYARLAETCASCGLVFRREHGAQTGSMYLTAVVTEVVAAAMVGLAWVFTDWETPTFLAVSVPAILVFGAWFLPLSQALWVAIEYSTDAANGESWVEPQP